MAAEMSTRMTLEFKSKYICSSADNNRVHYVYRTDEDKAAPLLIFLHGFPENSFAWIDYLEFFAELGCSVVAVDMRGLGLSIGYQKKTAYQISLMVNDVADVILTLEYNKAFIIGHDIGGVVAWEFAKTAPQLCQGAITINCPHPAAFSRMFKYNPLLTIRQTFRFWYMYFFQLPGVPEWLMRKGNFFWLDYIFKRWIYKKAVFRAIQMPARLSLYKKFLSKKNALKESLTSYRVNVFGVFGRSVLRRFITKTKKENLDTPFLVIWGGDDFVLENRLFEETKYIISENSTDHKIVHGGHWLHHEYFEECVGEISKHISNCGGNINITEATNTKRYSQSIAKMYKAFI